MLKNENIICISSIDWDFIWQGHQEIMSAFAKEGNRVLFIENTGVRTPGIRDIGRIKRRIKNWFSGTSGIRKEADNLYIFSPIVLPFPYLRIALWLNRNLILRVLHKWTKIMNFNNPIIWVFLPSPLSLDIINNLNSKVIVYYCIDNFRASSSSAKKIKSSEVKLLKAADSVFVTSKELYDYCYDYNKKVYLFPFAVDYDKFEKVRLSKSLAPEAIKSIKSPIVGYVGGMHKWIDFELIKEAAQKYPQYSFVFVGPIQADVSLLSGLKNIYFLGKMSHEEIPYFIKNFDVCIVPYLITEYTKSVYPTKLNEYLAMGKPVVSTNLPEIRQFNIENQNLVVIAENNDVFIRSISEAINYTNDKLIEKRITVARNNSWINRIAEMSKLIELAIDERNKIVLDWREEFLRLSRIMFKKISSAILVMSSVYLLVFYTPLIWFLGQPLKITQAPLNSDAIVVFAGGVGESGKAGQGYEERVQYAVELYKQGYAPYMVFSSGYRYVFEEALMMKILAVSLGVPEKAIILEDKATNTFENVKFTKGILDKNEWDEVLLVSSPYHMLRASLLFKKVAKEMRLCYTPIPKSLFYSRQQITPEGKRSFRQINIQQVKGIFHEYLGILYYWWKGYI